MGQISLAIPQVGQFNSTEDPKVASDFTTLQTLVNGNIDAANITDGSLTPTEFTAAINQAAGFNDGSNVRTGHSVIASAEQRTNTTYGTLTTPDQVANVIVPANGRLEILFSALWQVNGAGTFGAAVFLGANQLKITSPGAAPVVQETGYGGANLNQDAALYSTAAGLVSGNNGAGNTTEVATGQIHGAGWSPIYVDVPAGTYTVSVRFKASANTVTVKNRVLQVKALGF